jgi:chemotaxis protein MotB
MKKKPKPIVLTVGAPEWMTTYSDMMSLLLCFFILLFSAAEEKQEKVFELVMGFEQYFQGKGERLGYYPKRITVRDIPGFLDNAVRPPARTGSLGRTLTRREVVEKIDQYASIYREDNHELIVIPGMVLFERGRAEIREEAAPTLSRVARLLRKRGNANLKIVGHASSWPLDASADAGDHLALGFQRALAVARHLEIREGVSMRTMTLASLGNQVPNPSRRNLWDDPDQDDRVEIFFLPPYDIE